MVIITCALWLSLVGQSPRTQVLTRYEVLKNELLKSKIQKG